MAAGEEKTLDDVLLECEEAMEKAVSFLTEELRSIRTGRASSALVDTIKVDYYGSPTNLNQLANISVPEPRLIVIKAFDPSSLGAIEKAILKSELGVTPQNDGKVVRIAIPPLSEERRKQLAQRLGKMAEESKVTLRNARRDANKLLDQVAKGQSMSEDAVDRAAEEVQSLLKTYEAKIDEVAKKKSAEIMEI